jgi:hypothetical protein
MNEHDMQDILTPRWQTSGITVNGQRLFLAAWEVMTFDLKMNRWGAKWSPSVDFCFLDVDGRFWLLEFKPKLTARGGSWSALFQVTHRAVLFSRVVNHARFEALYLECRTTSERSSDRTMPKPLLEAHAAFFGLEHPLEPTAIGKLPLQRVVAAQTIGEKLWKAATAFDSHGHEEIMTAFGGTGLKLNLEDTRNERTRFATLGDWGTVLAPTIAGFETGLVTAEIRE